MKRRHSESMQQRVLSTIYREGAAWINDKADEPNKLKIVDLKPMAKDWHSFIMYTILPTNNTAEVTVQRSFLIYTIMIGGLIHIVLLIRDHIQKTTQENTQGPLPYASLITNLCIKAWLSTKGEETYWTLKPMKTLLWTNI